MKLFHTAVIAIALAGTASAEPPAKKPPPAAEEIKESDVHKFLAFWDKLVDTVVADKDSCPKMATDVNKLLDANAELLKQAKAAADQGKKLPKAAEDHVMEGVNKLLGGMMKCKDDKAVMKAFDRLNMGKK